MQFIQSFQSEWLKKKYSAAAWLTLAGSFLIPVIILIARSVQFDMLYPEVISPRFWEKLFNISWQTMAIILLPMGVVLATVLVTQLEFKNNTWKQVQTTPQPLWVIFFTKLLVILIMLVQFFVLFNLGIWLSGVVPSLIYRGIPFPQEAIPFWKFLKFNIKFFVDCLPIVALQYLLCLRFKNFLIPLGIGIGLVVTSMIAMSWKYGYVLPYIYCPLHFVGERSAVDQSVNIHLWAACYFVVITVISYVLYITKKEKG